MIYHTRPWSYDLAWGHLLLLAQVGQIFVIKGKWNVKLINYSISDTWPNIKKNEEREHILNMHELIKINF